MRSSTEVSRRNNTTRLNQGTRRSDSSGGSQNSNSNGASASHSRNSSSANTTNKRSTTTTTTTTRRRRSRQSQFHMMRLGSFFVPTTAWGDRIAKVSLCFLLCYFCILLYLHSSMSMLVSDEEEEEASLNTNGAAAFHTPLKAKMGQFLQVANRKEHDGHAVSPSKVGDESQGGAVVTEERYQTILHDMEEQLHMHSCRKTREGSYSLHSHKACFTKESKRITYYNPLDKERLLCNQLIPPKQSIELDEPCLEASRLYPVIPDFTAQGMPPTTVRFNDPNRRLPTKEFKECDVPCRIAGEPHIVSKRTIDDTNWDFEFSMEGPQYYPNLRFRPNAYKAHHFYATTSFQSEIPLPYFSFAEYDIQNNPPVDYDTAIKGAVFLARNCGSKNDREKVVEELQHSGFRTDSVSECLHNAEPPPGSDLRDKASVMQKYLFYLAFENQCEDDYITEKLWGPFVAGTVPVYMGAPNIKEHVPGNKSIISFHDFDTVQALADYLKKVAADKALYESYHAWRKQPLLPQFQTKYNITRTHNNCRTCRWAYARMHGLGWSHERQTILHPSEQDISREVRLDGHGYIVKPFREVWMDATRKMVVVEAQSDSLEAVGEGNRVATVNSGSGTTIRRTVWEKDGIVDLHLEAKGHVDSDGTAVLHLHLETPFSAGSAKAELPSLFLIGQGHLRLQNQTSRFTLLTWPKDVDVTSMNIDSMSITSTSTSSAMAATLIVPIPTNSLPMRLRCIVEDVDSFHEGAHLEENYFGLQMINDFYNPVEAFVDG